jgi:predicted anti-sigma-YlaC factor YlaD
MNCDVWRVFLQDYLDGALSEPAKAAIDRHLSDCAACLADARAHRQATGLLENQAVVEPPAGLVDRVMARIGRAAGSWRRELHRHAAAALLLVAVGFGGLTVWKSFVPAERARDAQSTIESGIMPPGAQLEDVIKKAGLQP